MTFDILYVTWNRLEYTKFSFEALLANTDWSYVRRLLVHDDGSTDGTLEYIVEAAKRAPVPHVINRGRTLNSPPAIMNRYVAASDTYAFVKIDNDIVVPPGWAQAMAGVMVRNPELELLGMSVGFAGDPPPDWDGIYGYTRCSHIGGIGLMRVDAFRRRPTLPEGQGRFGFTGWQENNDPVRGWITPDILTFELDKVPVDPWARLGRLYVRQGRQRKWPAYDRPEFWEWAFR